MPSESWTTNKPTEMLVRYYFRFVCALCGEAYLRFQSRPDVGQIDVSDLADESKSSSDSS